VPPAVAALVARMEELLRALESAREPGRFFLGTYLRTTRAVGAALDRGGFEDPDWVAAWDVDFAELYLDALEASRQDAESVAAPWRLAFGARAGLPPEAHVLLGMNAHINDTVVLRTTPRSRAVPRCDEPRRPSSRRPPAPTRQDPSVGSARAGAALQRVGGRRTPLDPVLAPANRQASRLFLRESRRKVWANTGALHAARLRGPNAYAERLAQLEGASAERVRDLLRPGPVLLRLAVRGFGVALPAG
jgi:hypothetical protein